MRALAEYLQQVWVGQTMCRNKILLAAQPLAKGQQRFMTQLIQGTTNVRLSVPEAPGFICCTGRFFLRSSFKITAPGAKGSRSRERASSALRDETNSADGE